MKALVGQVEADPTKSDGQHHYSNPERELTQTYDLQITLDTCSEILLITEPYRFYQTQTSFRASLCDSFNTPEALGHLRDLVSRTNIYINGQGKNLNIGLVENVGHWVGKMLRMFGLGEGPSEKSDIGWGQEGVGGADNVNVGNNSQLYKTK